MITYRMAGSLLRIREAVSAPFTVSLTYARMHHLESQEAFHSLLFPVLKAC